MRGGHTRVAAAGCWLLVASCYCVAVGGWWWMLAPASYRQWSMLSSWQSRLLKRGHANHVRTTMPAAWYRGGVAMKGLLLLIICSSSPWCWWWEDPFCPPHPVRILVASDSDVLHTHPPASTSPANDCYCYCYYCYCYCCYCSYYCCSNCLLPTATATATATASASDADGADDRTRYPLLLHFHDTVAVVTYCIWLLAAQRFLFMIVKRSSILSATRTKNNTASSGYCIR